jgi:hypothetical protein
MPVQVSGPVSQESAGKDFANAFQVLHHACKVEFAALNGFVNKQDAEALARGHLTGRRKLIAQFQAGKRRILEGCMQVHEAAQKLVFQ